MTADKSVEVCETGVMKEVDFCGPILLLVLVHRGTVVVVVDDAFHDTIQSQTVSCADVGFNVFAAKE